VLELLERLPIREADFYPMKQAGIPSSPYRRLLRAVREVK